MTTIDPTRPGADPGPSQGSIGTYAASFGVALGVTALLSGLLVIVKETNEDTVLALMKAATGHHWITHGLIDLALFVILGFALAGAAGRWRQRPRLVLSWLVGGSILGSLLVAGFYL